MPASKSTDSSPPPEPNAATGGPPRRPVSAVRRPPRGQLPAQGAPVPPPRTNRSPKSPPLIETAGPDPEVPLADVRLAVGVVAGIHGVQGELKVRLSTDDPEHLKRIKRVYLGDEEQTRRLVAIRMHQGMALIRIGGVTTPEVARTLIGQPIRISGRDARPLEAGEFYYYQVIGAEAFDERGERVGVVKDILETGANDVFVISGDAGAADLLLPNTPECILEIDPSRRRVVVRKLRYWDER